MPCLGSFGFPIFLEGEHRVSQPLGVVYIHDEACGHEPCYLFTNGLTPMFTKMVQVLLDGLGTFLNVQGMLCDVPRNPWHVEGNAHEYVSVFLEEKDKCLFLLGAKFSADMHELYGINQVNLDFLGVMHRLEQQGACALLGWWCFLGNF